MATKGNRLVCELGERRTIYNLGPNLPITQDQCTRLICDVARQCPSGFNAQGSRLVILYGDEHKKLWGILREAFGKVDMPPAAREQSLKKLETCFLAGAGTVLFFEDWDTVTGLQKKLPLYKDDFPVFAHHNHGITAYAVWCALAAAGVGASLQHYGPLIEVQVREAFHVPASWRLIAQMPFGEILKPAEGSVPRMPDEKRFVVLGKL